MVALAGATYWSPVDLEFRPVEVVTAVDQPDRHEEVGLVAHDHLQAVTRVVDAFAHDDADLALAVWCGGKQDAGTGVTADAETGDGGRAPEPDRYGRAREKLHPDAALLVLVAADTPYHAHAPVARALGPDADQDTDLDPVGFHGGDDGAVAAVADVLDDPALRCLFLAEIERVAV